MIRALLPADVPAARTVAWAAISALNLRLGATSPELTPERVRGGEARIAHLQQTDPRGAWVAEVGTEVVGCALSLVREGMWFLSLLMVAPPHQGRGLGKLLLEAALQTSTQRSWILATEEPAALRRYQRAGFDLHASYTAKGPVDRALLPAITGVREGSCAKDGELVDAVVKHCRGAALTIDLGYLAGIPLRMFVVDEPSGRGFALLRDGRLAWLGATTDDAARRLLWTALAEVGDTAEVDWLSANQQWAIDVCLDAHLSLGAGASLCLRGQPMMSPYLPNGALG